MVITPYGLSMRRVIALALIFSLITPYSHAIAAETTIPGFATINYPNTVKLKKSGCQDLNFEYETDDSLSRENTVFLIQIIHTSKKVIYGDGAWYSTLTSRGPEALMAMSRIGTVPMKVCRKPWLSGKGVNQVKVPGINPGTYRLYFAGVYVDPVTGGKLGEKIEVMKTIKFS